MMPLTRALRPSSCCEHSADALHGPTLHACAGGQRQHCAWGQPYHLDNEREARRRCGAFLRRLGAAYVSGVQHFLTCSSRGSCHRGLQLRPKCAIAAPSLAHQPAWSPQVPEVRRPAVAIISVTIQHRIAAATTHERMAACMLCVCRVREQAPSPSSNGLALVLIDCTQQAACTSSDAQPTSQVLGHFCYCECAAGLGSAEYNAWHVATQTPTLHHASLYGLPACIDSPWDAISHCLQLQHPFSLCACLQALQTTPLESANAPAAPRFAVRQQCAAPSGFVAIDIPGEHGKHTSSVRCICIV